MPPLLFQSLELIGHGRPRSVPGRGSPSGFPVRSERRQSPRVGPSIARFAAIPPQKLPLKSRPEMGPPEMGFHRKRWGDRSLIFLAERSGLPVRLERHCRHAEIRAGWPQPGSLPRWRRRHCGVSVVTAPGAVTTKKDPKMSHGKTPRKTEAARAKSRANGPARRRTVPQGSTPVAGPSRRPPSPCSDSQRGQRSPPS
jgi:hypothetical protein